MLRCAQHDGGVCCSMKNTLHFFVDPTTLTHDEIDLDDSALAHQLGRVLRLGPGARVLLLDGLGMACEVELTALTRTGLRGLVCERRPAAGEPSWHATLFLALLRPERFEWALQKAVELGVTRVVPVVFERSLPSDRADGKKIERWQRIVREAAEQSCRGVLPRVEAPVSFVAACQAAASATLPLLLWEGQAPLLRERLRAANKPASISLLSGPEGGIAPAELTTASEHGIMPVSLGPRILRAETAPVAAIAALGYEYG
ncbi:MAG: 16S rRNA (uracil(1498)-N(3))-methyltransferase [Candidatus Viridilinea halotolerans]|uniref:Ribosomal RNA small subunit methyltransferase E n=1 Tax=Candidatus Viridilinea halotolerans TaxID=2491704 RepID=A0A426UB13_9CHLR|nr:MAG: 16S rRNA (uracil(1498)-N(3))-methyltransferase [Candidatus Viridilinea halotolerans]